MSFQVCPARFGKFLGATLSLFPLVDNDKAYAEKPIGADSQAVSRCNENQNNVFPEEHKEYIRKNFWRLDSYYAVKDPRWVIDEKDIVLSMDEPNSYFALGAPQNKTFPVNDSKKYVTKRFPGRLFTPKDYFRENFHTFYAIGYAHNKDVILEFPQDIELARNEPNGWATYYLTQRDDWPFEDPEKKIIETEPKSPYARGIVRNKKCYVWEGAKEVSRKNPHTDVAAVLARKGGWRVEDKDTGVSFGNARNSEYTYYLVQKIQNIRDEHVQFARENLNTDFAVIASNPNYVTQRNLEEVLVDLFIARDNRGSMFSEEFFANPALKQKLGVPLFLLLLGGFGVIRTSNYISNKGLRNNRSYLSFDEFDQFMQALEKYRNIKTV